MRRDKQADGIARAVLESQSIYRTKDPLRYRRVWRRGETRLQSAYAEWIRQRKQQELSASGSVFHEGLLLGRHRFDVPVNLSDGDTLTLAMEVSLG